MLRMVCLIGWNHYFFCWPILSVSLGKLQKFHLATLNNLFSLCSFSFVSVTFFHREARWLGILSSYKRLWLWLARFAKCLIWRSIKSPWRTDVEEGFAWTVPSCSRVSRLKERSMSMRHVWGFDEESIMKRAYIKHQYSGPKPNPKRVKAAIQHHHGPGITSLVLVLCTY